MNLPKRKQKQDKPKRMGTIDTVQLGYLRHFGVASTTVQNIRNYFIHMEHQKLKYSSNLRTLIIMKNVGTV